MRCDAMRCNSMRYAKLVEIGCDVHIDMGNGVKVDGQVECSEQASVTTCLPF